MSFLARIPFPFSQFVHFWLTTPPPWPWTSFMDANKWVWMKPCQLSFVSGHLVGLSVVKFQTTSRIVATLVTKNVAKWIQSQFSPKFCLKGAFFFYRYECTDKNAFWQCEYVGPINPAQVAKKVLRKEAKIIGQQKLPYIPKTVDIFGYTCKCS